MTDSPADPPPTSTQNPPPAPVPPTQRPAPAWGLTPRCPSCLYTLEGCPDVGVCPECGTAYSDTSRFDYAQRNGFLRTAASFLWPALIGPVLLVPLLNVIEGGAIVLGMLLVLANSLFAGFAFVRRRRIRALRPGESYVGGGATIAEGLGCGLLAAVGVFFVGFVVSCFVGIIIYG
jgi:hypothetical protein